MNYHFNSFTREAFLVEEDRVLYFKDAVGSQMFEVIIKRPNSYFDDSTIDWIQGRLYLSELDLEMGTQLIEIIDIHNRNSSNQFPTAVFFEFDPPRAAVPITHFSKTIE